MCKVLLHYILTYNKKFMTVTTESGGRQNAFPTEVQPRLVENYEGYGKNAERLNGRLAMLGLVAGFIY